ncbi:MAG: hypothetical protein AAF787_19250 [Chloroflexota bacterium]
MLIRHKFTIVVIVLLTTVFTGSLVYAQSSPDPTLNPAYGTLTAVEGRSVIEERVLSGGNADISRLNIRNNPDCHGYTTPQPTISVRVSDSDITRLIFEFMSGGDTTLIVRNPDGLWWCDDDDGEGLNGALSIGGGDVEMGTYDIWIGSFWSDESWRGTFSVRAMNYRPYAMVCIENATSQSLNFSYRWGSGNWQTSTIRPGAQLWFSKEYSSPTGPRNSPAFVIDFDANMGGGADDRETYTLERTASPEQSCDGINAYTFDFVSGRNRINLYR